MQRHTKFVFYCIFSKFYFSDHPEASSCDMVCDGKGEEWDIHCSRKVSLFYSLSGNAFVWIVCSDVSTAAGVSLEF